VKYELRGDTLPVVILTLEQGESVFTESGGMSWMSEGFEMKTNMKGGIFGGIARTLAGESLFMTTYTMNKASGIIAFSSSFPGKIVPIHLQAGESIICQKSVFLCAEHSVKLATHLKKKLGAGFFGGEGFILQKVTGPGWCFLEIDGEAVEYQLGSGEKMKVDTGHVAVFESSVNYDIEMVKGFRNILFGGEGLFLTTLQGPGKVWLQSMPINNLAARIIPYIPSSNE
jgi:uncharacterized protein (TIGR00266 family)